MLDDIKKKWDLWNCMPFPREAYELDDFDLVSVDTFSAGCISVYVDREGVLDNHREGVLRTCVCDLDKVLSHLSGETREYFDTLSSLSKMVLTSLDQKKKR